MTDGVPVLSKLHNFEDRLIPILRKFNFVIGYMGAIWDK